MMLNITSIPLLVGARSLPKVLPNNSRTHMIYQYAVVKHNMTTVKKTVKHAKYANVQVYQYAVVRHAWNNSIHFFGRNGTSVTQFDVLFIQINNVRKNYGTSVILNNSRLLRDFF